MGLLGYLGYLGVGLGPGAAVFAVCVAPRPALVVAAIASAFLWLSALLAASALWRPFAPLPGGARAAAAPLIFTVAATEVLRPLFWRGCRRLEAGLEAAANQRPGGARARMTYADRAALAVAVGLGEALAHAVLLWLSTATLALGSATRYLPACPQMDFFLAGALSSAAFSLVFSFGNFLAFSGYAEGRRGLALWTPAAHLGGALASLLSFAPGGCVGAVAVQGALAALTLGVAARVFWLRTDPRGRAWNAL